MDICISILILLLETLTILMCMYISFNKKIHFDKYVIGILVISCFIYLLINNKVIPQLCGVLAYGFIWLYCYNKFKLTLGRTMLKFLFGCILATLIEALVACAFSPLYSAWDEKIVLNLFSLFSFVVVVIIYVNVTRSSKKVKYRTGRNLFIGIALLGIAFGGLLWDHHKNNAPISLYVVVIMVFVGGIYICAYMLEAYHKEVERKNAELEIQAIYGGAYKELLAEVRRKQHDFKNQLGAMYSMHLVAKSLDDLIVMQKEYGNGLVSGCKYDSILTCCGNSILAGYIYYKCISCEKQGIDVFYDIHIDDAKCSIALHEIIEVLGILIDNACESVNGDITVSKCISLDFSENDEKIKFAVSNPVQYLSSVEIDRMFKEGFSTKGKNRGIGLARVKDLVCEYDAEIIVSNRMISDMNWVDFIISIKK